MLELPSGLWINLSQVCSIRSFRDVYSVQFNHATINITKEDMDKIKEVSNLGMSILNEASKALL